MEKANINDKENINNKKEDEMSEIEKAKLHLEKGLSYLRMQQTDAAIEEFKMSLSYSPEALAPIVNLATEIKERGLYDDAIAILEFLVEDASAFCGNNQLGLIFYNLGNTYRDNKQQEKAIENYKRALDKRPEHASTWFNLGQSYFALTRYEEAADAYNRALECNPDHPDAKLRLDLIQDLKASGELEWAKGVMTKPEDKYEKILIPGVKYCIQEKYRSAINEFKRALTIYPDEGEVYIRLAGAQLDLMQSEDKNEVSVLRENLELLDKAQHLICSGKSKRSMDKYRGLSELHDIKARCLVLLEDYKLAKEELENSLEIDPNREDSSRLLFKLKGLIDVTKEK